MMMKKSIQFFIFAISFLLATSCTFTSAFVPNDCLSCRSRKSPLGTLSLSPPNKSTMMHSQQQQEPFLVSSLAATAVDDSLVETQQKSPSPLPPNPNDDEESSSSMDLVSSRVINSLFLALAFGYAAYTILNIDSGMTRGWTTGEIAMRIPLDNWGAYEDYLANKPIFTKTLINVIIYLLGDWLSQTAFQGKNVLDFDIKRTLRNGFIGLCFGPLVHEYYQFSDTILPPENGLVTRLEKIFMDQTIYLTVKCSIYISAVGLLGGDDWPTVKQTVQDKIGGVVVTAWKFWPLVHCITYGLIPARHRILWVNSVDLVWNAILASQAQKTDDDDDVEGGEEGMTDGLVLEAVATEVLEINDDDDDIIKAEKHEVPALMLEKHSLLESSSESLSTTTTTTIDLIELNDTNFKPSAGSSNSTEELLVSH